MVESLKRYLLNKKEEIKNLNVKKRLIHHSFSIEFVSCIIGPRRAGKTYFLYDLILNKLNLRDSDYLFVNFEDDEIKRIDREKISNIIHYHNEIYGKYPQYLFFDEIQALENWQSFIYSFYEKKKYFIFITGSSSKLSSREIATQLRGRSYSLKVLPFSFKEILSIKNFDLNKNIFSSYEESEIKHVLKNYLDRGGFPQLWIEKINEKIFFRDYVDVIIFKDIVDRFKIRNITAIKMLISSCVSSFSKEFSIKKIYNTLKSTGIKISKNSLYLYSSMLREVMFCFNVYKFSYSEREILGSIPKIHICDVGIPNFYLSSKIDENIGRIMENVVFLELYRNENIDVFYWKDYQQNEVDFVIKEGLEIKQLIQVTYASNKDEIEKREIKALLKASELLKCKDLLIITWDYEDEIKINNKTIKCIPLWKWLLF
ncbi:MAG: ATP-binding protein [Candidatus Aenigmatarchaeota archaeon]